MEYPNVDPKRTPTEYLATGMGETAPRKIAEAVENYQRILTRMVTTLDVFDATGEALRE